MNILFRDADFGFLVAACVYWMLECCDRSETVVEKVAAGLTFGPKLC
jgi:hypothetical protein